MTESTELTERAARGLLRPLDEVAPPPPTVDVGALVAAGRRRVRRRRIAGAGVGAAFAAVALMAAPLAVAAVVRDLSVQAPLADSSRAAAAASAPPPVAPAAPTSCAAQRLPVPAGTVASYVTDGDPTGRYLVGTATGPTGGGAALLWDNGRLTVLRPPTGNDVSNLVVNSRGEVAGDGYARGGFVAWVYRDGRYTTLPMLRTGPGSIINVADINERGDVLGSDQTMEHSGTGGGTASERPSGSGSAAGEENPPVIWPADAPGTVRPLRLPKEPGLVFAKGIDDDGTVVGARSEPPVPGTDASTAVSRGLVWSPTGELRELPAPPGAGPNVSVAAIRDGWVTGTADSPAAPNPPGYGVYRWNLRTGQIDAVRGLGWVAGVNRYGWVSGFTRDPSGVEHPAVAFGDRVLVLPDLTDGVASREGPSAGPVSDDGRVVGGVLTAGRDDGHVAVRWTCT